MGSSVGANVLPAVVNLQYPGKEASGWDKALYYGGNTGLSLAGGLTGGLIAAGRNMAKAGLQGAKQAVKEADVPSPETIYRQGLKNTTALDTVLKGQDGIGGISLLPNPAQSDILNYQTITGGLNGTEQIRNSLAGGQNAHAAFSQEIAGNRLYSGGNGLQITRSGADGSSVKSVEMEFNRPVEKGTPIGRRGTLAGDSGLGNEVRGTYIRGGVDGVWRPSEVLRNEYTKEGLPAPEFIELPPTQEAARRFRNSISEAKKSMGTKGVSVDVYPVDEYQNMRLFLAKDRLSGVAVKPDGTIVSVFKNNTAPKGSADALMEVAISAGGNKLDAYDIYLPKIYARHGFKVTDRLTWDDQFKPDGWSYDFFKDFNGGRPDVQALSLWSKNTPEGAIKNAQKMVDSYNKLNPGKKITLTVEQANKIRELQKQAMSLPEGVPTTYYMKKYTNQRKPFYDLVMQRRENEIYNKFPTPNVRNAAKNFLNEKAAHGNLSTTPFHGKHLRIDPSSNGPVKYISKIREFVKKMF